MSVAGINFIINGKTNTPPTTARIRCAEVMIFEKGSSRTCRAHFLACLYRLLFSGVSMASPLRLVPEIRSISSIEVSRIFFNWLNESLVKLIPNGFSLGKKSAKSSPRRINSSVNATCVAVPVKETASDGRKPVRFDIIRPLKGASGEKF